MSLPVDQDLLERPIHTKDDDYVEVVVEDIDNENRKLVVRGRNDMQTMARCCWIWPEMTLSDMTSRLGVGKIANQAYTARCTAESQSGQ